MQFTFDRHDVVALDRLDLRQMEASPFAAITNIGITP